MLRLKILTSCRPSCLLAVPLKANTAVPPSSHPTCTCTPHNLRLHNPCQRLCKQRLLNHLLMAASHASAYQRGRVGSRPRQEP